MNVIFMLRHAQKMTQNGSSTCVEIQLQAFELKSAMLYYRSLQTMFLIELIFAFNQSKFFDQCYLKRKMVF